MTRNLTDLINGDRKGGLERIEYWLKKDPDLLNGELVQLTGLKNSDVVAWYISRNQLRKAMQL